MTLLNHHRNLLKFAIVKMQLMARLGLFLHKNIFLCLIVIFTITNPANAQTLQRGFGWPLDLSILDPHKITSDTLLAVTKHFLATLVIVDEQDQLQPRLAKSWEFDEKGEHLTFFLREDAIWSDGTAINAYSVEKSLLRVLSPVTTSDAQVLVAFLKNDVENATQAEALSSGSNPNIEVIDEFTIRFAVENTSPLWVKTFSHVITAPLPLHQLNSEQVFPLNSLILSSGPYKLLYNDNSNGKVALEENKFYVGKKPHYKEVIFEFGEYEYLIEKYLKNQLDVLEYIDPTQREWLEIYYPRELVSRTTGGVYLLVNDNIYGEHSKPIRQALIGSLSQKTLFAISKAQKGAYKPTGLVYFSNKAYQPEPLDASYQISHEQAVQNMRDAGYNEQNRLKLCVTQHAIKVKEVLNYIKSQWQNLFVDVEFVNTETLSRAPQFFYHGENRVCNMVLLGYDVRLKTEEEILDALFLEGGGLPSLHLKNDKALNIKYNRLKKVTDPQKRLQLVAQLEKDVLENYSALLFSKTQNISLVKPYVKNYLQAARQNFIAESRYLQ